MSSVTIPNNFGSGGSGLTPNKSSGDPSLVEILQDLQKSTLAHAWITDDLSKVGGTVFANTDIQGALDFLASIEPVNGQTILGFDVSDFQNLRIPPAAGFPTLNTLGVSMFVPGFGGNVIWEDGHKFNSVWQPMGITLARFSFEASAGNPMFDTGNPEFVNTNRSRTMASNSGLIRFTNSTNEPYMRAANGGLFRLIPRSGGFFYDGTRHVLHEGDGQLVWDIQGGRGEIPADFHVSENAGDGRIQLNLSGSIQRGNQYQPEVQTEFTGLWEISSTRLPVLQQFVNPADGTRLQVDGTLEMSSLNRCGFTIADDLTFDNPGSRITGADFSHILSGTQFNVANGGANNGVTFTAAADGTATEVQTTVAPTAEGPIASTVTLAALNLTLPEGLARQTERLEIVNLGCDALNLVAPADHVINNDPSPIPSGRTATLAVGNGALGIVDPIGNNAVREYDAWLSA